MKNLVDNGCKVYEITDRLLHMKTYMVDDKHFTVGNRVYLNILVFMILFFLGSFNNDRWSWRLNNEMNLFIYDNAKES